MTICHSGKIWNTTQSFLYLLNRIKVAPENSLYIGDSKMYDVSGAKAAGMKTVLFSYHSNGDYDIADYTVKGLNELKKLMDKVSA